MNVNLRFKGTFGRAGHLMPGSGCRASRAQVQRSSGSGENRRHQYPERDCGHGGRKAGASAVAIAIRAQDKTNCRASQKQIEDLQRRLSEGARTLSDDEKAKLQRQGELLSRRLQRGNDDLNEELNAAQGEIVDAIGRKMLEVLDRYSRENGYTVVLDTSAQGSPVVYGSSRIGHHPGHRAPLRPGLSGQERRPRLGSAPKPAAPAPAKKPTP